MAMKEIYKINRWLEIGLYLLVFAAGIAIGRFLLPDDTPLSLADRSVAGSPNRLVFSLDQTESSSYPLPTDLVEPAWVNTESDSAKTVDIYLDMDCDYCRMFIQNTLMDTISVPNIALKIYLFSLDGKDTDESDLYAASAAKCVGTHYPDHFPEFLRAYTELDHPDAGAVNELAVSSGGFPDIDSAQNCAQARLEEVRLDFSIFASLGLDTSPYTMVAGRGISGYYPPAYFLKIIETSPAGQN